MNRDLRRALDDEPMRPFQWLAVAVCIVLNLIDGFDVLVMAFTASSVAAEWNLGGAEIGLLLSAGLFGMAAGSLFIAPWADRWGRRPLILACLALSGLGMLASALSQAAWQLALLRGLTGLGIGGILASSNVIASEYASRRWRGLAVSLQSTGYALGATAQRTARGMADRRLGLALGVRLRRWPDPGGDPAGLPVPAGVAGLPPGAPAAAGVATGQRAGPAPGPRGARGTAEPARWRSGAR